MNKTLETLGIGIFIVLSTVGTSFLLDSPEGYDYYKCEDTQALGLCWKLSNVNSEGLQTRCYWNESASRRYKTCSSGWELYNETKATGEIIDFERFIAPRKKEGERFIGNITFLADGEPVDCYLDEPNLDIADDFEACLSERYAGKEITRVRDWTNRTYNSSVKRFRRQR